MTGVTGAQVVEALDARTLALFIMDMRESLLRALARTTPLSDAATATFDALAEHAHGLSAGIINTAIQDDVELTPGMLRLILGGVIAEPTDQALNLMSDMAATIRIVWSEAATPSGSPDARIIDGVLDGLEGLAATRVNHIDAPELLEAAELVVRGCTNLATVLSELGQGGDAVACAFSAGNFAQMLGPARAEMTAALGIRLARRAGDQDSAGAGAARRAHQIARLARDDPARRLEAFEAFETALRWLPADANVRKTVVPVLQFWLGRERYLEPLPLMLWGLLPPAERDPSWRIPAELDDLSVGMRQVWDGSLQDFFKRIQKVALWSSQVENARLQLEPPAPAHGAARTAWSTWTIEHPALMRAVPNDESILREQDRDNLLLVLAHEMTHVFSLAGSIGIAMLALRWALFDQELTLWTFVHPEGVPSDIVNLLAPAPLDQAKLSDRLKSLALAQAEQAIEIERKIQIFESAWAPWLEGVAVWGELAADPRQDAEGQSPIVSVLYNLWDTPIHQVAENAGISVEEAVLKQFARAEQVHSAAMQQEGAYRLRDYLFGHPEVYLAGYLTVRAVVSAWRRTLGRPLSGAEAFAILLHATRYSGLDFVPDPALPLDEFTQAVGDRQLAWLQAIAGARPVDLNRVLDARTGTGAASVGWRNGRTRLVKRIERTEMTARRRFVTLARQALKSLRGAGAPLGRVPDAEGRLQWLMETIADRLTKASTQLRLFTPSSMDSILSRRLILPLGRFVCPFWLIPAERMVGCALRTRERDQETNQPSYNFMAFPLEEESYERLDKLVSESVETRMTVTRVADLSLSPNMAPGANALVFQFGEWLHIQPRGLFTGVSQLNEQFAELIEARLTPSPSFAFQELLTGEQHPAAARTRAWVGATDWQLNIIGDPPIDAQPWARRVSEVASAVIDGPSVADRRAIAARYLEFVFGDAALAMRLAERGLADLNIPGTDVVGKVVRALYTSAQRPTDDSTIEELNVTVAEELAPLFSRTGMTWDVIAPAALRQEVKR